MSALVARQVVVYTPTRDCRTSEDAQGVSFDTKVEEPDVQDPPYEPMTKAQARLIANRKRSARSRQRKINFEQKLEIETKKLEEEVERKIRTRDELRVELNSKLNDITIDNFLLFEAENDFYLLYNKIKENEKLLGERNAQFSGEIKQVLMELEPLIRDITQGRIVQADPSEVPRSSSGMSPQGRSNTMAVQSSGLSSPWVPQGFDPPGPSAPQDSSQLNVPRCVMLPYGRTPSFPLQDDISNE
eukprot:jgi/Botrbrau1/17622/Bobra.0166s0057.2